MCDECASDSVSVKDGLFVVKGKKKEKIYTEYCSRKNATTERAVCQVCSKSNLQTSEKRGS